jgi:hypothetical protein
MFESRRSKKRSSVRFQSRLLRRLTCVLGAGILTASPIRAQLIQTIGYDPMVLGTDPDRIDYLLTGVRYVPFAFHFGDDPYSLDSIKLYLLGNGDVSSLSLIVTSTLGTDDSEPLALATFSASGTAPDPTVFTFLPDSAPVLTSGSTYYLRMTLTAAIEVLWVSGQLAPPGAPPVDHGPSGPGGLPPPRPPDHAAGGGDVTLTPLIALNPGALTFRTINGTSSYIDLNGVYGISLTAASVVPEPSAAALFIGGGTLAFALLRRRFQKG